MPIKGRSDIVRIPRVGKIRLGVRKKTQSGKEYPTATDYFVVVADDSTSQAAAQAFHSVYGETPREIQIAFPSDNPEQFFPQYLSSYRGGNGQYKLFCRGDGERAQRDDGHGGYVDIPCPYKECEFYTGKKCKELGKLQFFLPEVPGIGIWQLDTTSFHSTVRINSAIQMIQALTGGRIKMVPLTLRLVPQVVSPEGKPKTVHVLELAVQDVRLKDFIQQIPLLSAALAPQVEPIKLDEMPDDLYIDRDVVPDGTPAANTPTGDDRLVVLVDIEVQPDRQQRPIGKVRMANRQGEMIEALTDNVSLIETVKAWPQGTALSVVLENSARWRNRKEIVELRAIS